LNSIEKWAERVYAESDFGRSVATSLSGLLGLVIYLIRRDWVIAAFASMIFFPIVRLTATAIHTRLSRGANRRAKRDDAEDVYGSLSGEEKAVVSEFVSAGGCVLTWTQINRSPVSGSAIESLIRREILSTSVTADGMRETFVLDPQVFDVGVSCGKKQGAPS